MNKSDNRRRTSRELFVSMSLTCHMRVRGELNINRGNVFHEDFSHDIVRPAIDGRFLMHEIPDQHAINAARRHVNEPLYPVLGQVW